MGMFPIIYKQIKPNRFLILGILDHFSSLELILISWLSSGFSFSSV
jgi:hypothetical protein